MSLSNRVADPHHFNADPDPAFHFNADPDLAFHFNADPDPAFHFNEDPDPLFHFNLEPDPAFHLMHIGIQLSTLVPVGSSYSSNCDGNLRPASTGLKTL